MDRATAAEREPDATGGPAEPDAAAGPARASRRRSRARWAALAAVAALGCGWALWQEHTAPGSLGRALASAVAAARSVPVAVFVTAVVLAMVQNALGAVRLHVVARLEGSILDTVREVSLGQLANAFLPGRAGDALKVVRLGGQHGLARAAGGVLVADKLVDVASVALVLLAGAFTLARDSGLVALVSVGVLALLPIAAVVLHRAGPRTGRIGRMLTDALAGLRSPGRVVAALGISVLSWVAEATALVLVVHAAHYSLSMPAALFGLALLNVAIAVPITPANAATFEAGLGLAIVQSGIPAPAAIGLAAVHHVCQLGGVVLVPPLASLSRLRRRAAHGRAGEQGGGPTRGSPEAEPDPG